MSLSINIKRIILLIVFLVFFFMIIFALFLPLIRLLWGYIKDFSTPSKYLVRKIKLQNNIANITCEASEHKLRNLIENNLQQGMVLSLKENSSNIILIEKEYLQYTKLQDKIFKWDKKIYKLIFKPKY